METSRRQIVASVTVRISGRSSIPTVGPVIFGDELLYKQFAFKLFNFDTYGSGQYPLLYPAFLAPSFLFGENFYEAMKISNSVVSSLMIIPVFLISRLFLSEKESLLVVLSAAVAPYHYVFPQLLMSENLFLPLMLAGVYIAIRKPDRNLLAWDIATGIITGLLYLTRHISLVIIIALALTWLITNYERSWRVWLRCAIILAVASATYSPWILRHITGYRAETCSAPAPSFTAIQGRLPRSELVTYSDGGPSSRVSNQCGKRVPTRAVNATAVKVGREVKRYQSGTVAIVVK